MDTKQNTANQIYRFFKAFQISIPTCVGVFLVIFILVFEANKSLNPDLSAVRIIQPVWDSSGLSYEPGTGRIIFGNQFNRKVWYARNGSMYSVPNSTENFKEQMLISHRNYLNEKLIESILYSFIALFGIPTIVVIYHEILKTTKKTKDWVNNNKSI